jgi:hypothetical protein
MHYPRVYFLFLYCMLTFFRDWARATLIPRSLNTARTPYTRVFAATRAVNRNICFKIPRPGQSPRSEHILALTILQLQAAAMILVVPAGQARLQHSIRRRKHASRISLVDHHAKSTKAACFVSVCRPGPTRPRMPGLRGAAGQHVLYLVLYLLYLPLSLLFSLSTKIFSS